MIFRRAKRIGDKPEVVEPLQTQSNYNPRNSAKVVEGVELISRKVLERYIVDYCTFTVKKDLAKYNVMFGETDTFGVWRVVIWVVVKNDTLATKPIVSYVSSFPDIPTADSAKDQLHRCLQYLHG